MTILPMIASYIVILSVTFGISKIKPGIVAYQKPKPENFKMLNQIHLFFSIIMMLPLFTADIQGRFLLFPDKISIEKTIAFLTCFGAIIFFPWKKLYDDDQKTEQAILHAFPVFLYGFLRLIFVVSYECFFRGSLLMSFSFLAGTTWSIIINVSLYTLIHLHKDKKEIIGCIPFGLLVCLFTVWWQSVWPAIIFHSQLLIIHEWPSLRKFTSPKKQAAL